MQTTKRMAAVHLQPPRCHPNQQPLPAEPLLAAVSSYATRRQLSLNLLFDQAARQALQRARRSGVVTLVVVERFCDELGLHPREMYGDAYDRAAFTYVARRPKPVPAPARSGGER
jgi:hypothetical protein